MPVAVAVAGIANQIVEQIFNRVNMFMPNQAISFKHTPHASRHLSGLGEYLCKYLSIRVSASECVCVLAWPPLHPDSNIMYCTIYALYIQKS